MRILIWLLRAAIFVLLLGFAIKNDGMVLVQGFFGASWETPLVVVILACLALGVLIGAGAMAASSLGMHRELRRLRRQLSSPLPASSAPKRDLADDIASV